MKISKRTTRVLFANEPTDLRTSREQLRREIESLVGEQSAPDILFVFWNEKRDRLRALQFQRDRILELRVVLTEGQLDLTRGDDGTTVEIGRGEVIGLLESARRRRRPRRLAAAS